MCPLVSGESIIKTMIVAVFCRWPYRAECTGSLPTSEVKRHRARLVLGWGPAWEDLRVLPAHQTQQGKGEERGKGRGKGKGKGKGKERKGKERKGNERNGERKSKRKRKRIRK